MDRKKGNCFTWSSNCERLFLRAGSIVSKYIPDYAVAVGNPAKVVKYRDSSVFEDLFNKKDSFVYEVFGYNKEFIKKIKN